MIFHLFLASIFVCARRLTVDCGRRGLGRMHKERIIFQSAGNDNTQTETFRRRRPSPQQFEAGFLLVSRVRFGFRIFQPRGRGGDKNGQI